MIEDKRFVPEGYDLILEKRNSCPLCQRPVFRGLWDRGIWSRQHSTAILKAQIEEDLGLIFTPREIFLHSTHFKLVPTDKKITQQEKADMQANVINKEKELLELNDQRKDIVYDFDGGLDGMIKSLSAEINELKMEGFENDPGYLRKVEQYRRLLETKYKKEDEISDDKICLISVEVDDLVNSYLKKKEEKNKNGKVPDKGN